MESTLRGRGTIATSSTSPPWWIPSGRRGLIELLTSAAVTGNLATRANHPANASTAEELFSQAQQSQNTVGFFMIANGNTSPGTLSAGNVCSI